MCPASADVSPELVSLLRAASTDPAVRGRVLWFPDEICEEYGVVGAEAEAVEGADLGSLAMPQEVAVLAEVVFNTHDLHAGE